MRQGINLLILTGLLATTLHGQEPPPPAPAESTPPVEQPEAAAAPAAPPAPSPAKRGWMNRVMHPFGSSAKKPDESVSSPVKDPKLKGLVLSVQVTPQTIKLSETRQLSVKATLTNTSKKAIELSFQTDQRIEIYLKNATETVLARWSDNHAVKDKPFSVLINPQEHLEYNETITTRELTPDKVFTAEVFFPKYPELRGRQKFLTAP